MYSSIPVAIVRLSEDGGLTLANPTAAALLSVPADQTLDLKALLQLDSPSSVRQIVASLNRAGAWEGEMLLRLPDDPDKSLRLQGRFALETGGGFAIGTLEAKEDLFALRRRLEETERYLALGRMAGGIAHNLNNTMVGVLGYASLLSAMLTDDEKVARYLSRIVTSSEKAADLVRQFLSFSSKSEGHPVHLNLADVAEIAAKLYIKSDQNFVTLCYDITPDLPHLYADPCEAQQLFNSLFFLCQDLAAGRPLDMSLTVRGLDADETPDNPAQVREAILIDFRAEADFPVEATWDNLQALQQPADRGRPSFGCAYVSEVARKLHGWMDYERLERAGRQVAHFRIYLPPRKALEKQPVPSLAESGWKGSPGHGGQKPQRPGGNAVVLVVDDEALVRELVKDLLTDQGYEVILADCGQEGIDFFTRSPVDLVILDRSMPDMDGLVVYQALRKASQTTPVLLSSGHSIEEIREEMPDDPHLDFIQKPYHYSDFLQMVRRLTGS